jgi:hypothetical protein
MDVILREIIRGGFMNISIKKVLSTNYKSQFWLSFSIVAPIFGVCALLSVYGVIPKFKLTENMTGLTAALIMLLCIGIMIVGIFVIKNTITQLRNIVSNGEALTAIITDTFAMKHQLLINYEFVYEGKTYKEKHNITKKFNYKEKYSKGKDLKIYVLKNRDDKILAVPDIY